MSNNRDNIYGVILQEISSFVATNDMASDELG